MCRGVSLVTQKKISQIPKSSFEERERERERESFNCRIVIKKEKIWVKSSHQKRVRHFFFCFERVARSRKRRKREFTKNFVFFWTVAKHKSKKDCWVILNNNVYNVTDFLPDHPGGKNAILLYAGKDGTKEFNMLHKPSILKRYGKQYLIGKVKTGNAKL